MTNERMTELLNNFIEHLMECNGNIEDTIMSLKHGIGMRQEEWKELGWDLTPDESNEKHEEIEFFEGDEGDEGDLDAEEYVNEEGLEPGSYEIEWDDYRKGYSLKVTNKS